MKIKRNNIDIITLGFTPDDAVETKQLMGEHYVSFSFELTENIALKKGDYIELEQSEFRLHRDYIPTINKSTGGYIYELTFYSFTKRFEDYKVKHEGDFEFNLRTTGDQFLRVVIDSIPFMQIEIGDFPLDIKTIHFDAIDAFSALNLIAEEYKLEWWFINNELNLGKCKHGTEIALVYDKEIEEINVSESVESKVTRLYAFGLNRNLPLSYGGKLRIPPIDVYPDLEESQVIEDVQSFDVYPRQTTKIINVEQVIIPETETTIETVYYIIEGDNLLGENPYEIKEEDRLPTKPLRIAFNSGSLAGKEFDLEIRGDNKYEIIYEEEDESYIPNKILKPEIGDEFFFFNFDPTNILPSLISNAETELRELAEELLEKQVNEFVYEIDLRSIEAEKLNIDLDIGQRVSITTPLIEEVKSRVQSYSKNLTNKFEASYQIGESPEYSRLTALEKETEDNRYQILSSAGITLEQAQAIVRSLGSRNFLSKIFNDVASGKITFEQGIVAQKLSELDETTFGEYIHGMLGIGARIDKFGNATVHNLISRKGIETPELRYNRVYVNAGVRWQTSGAGLIKSVEIDKAPNGDELQSGIITLKLEDGEIGAIKEDDLCMGVFHDFAGSNDTRTVDTKDGNFRFEGFNTVYFRVDEILDKNDNSKFRYILRGISENWKQQNHPAESMSFAGYANPTHPERQGAFYTTTDYELQLKDMTTWEFGEDNIVSIRGNLDGFKKGETHFEGYGSVISNGYFYGHLKQIIGVPVTMEIETDGDNFLGFGESITIKCKIMRGWDDITNTVEVWEITRETGDTANDTAWNIEHQNFAGQITLHHGKEYTDLGSSASTLFRIKAENNDMTLIQNLTI